MFAIYIFTFMYNSLVENGIKKKINEHSTSKYFVTIGIYRYISNKSLQFAVFIFIKIFHAKTFLNKLMKKCLLLLKTLECIVFKRPAHSVAFISKIQLHFINTITKQIIASYQI